MATANLETLWGRDLIAELRRQCADTTNFSEDEAKRLHSLMLRRGCVVERPSEDEEVMGIVLGVLTRAVEPLYLPYSPSQEGAQGGGVAPSRDPISRRARTAMRDHRRVRESADAVVEETDGDSPEAQDRARIRTGEIQRLRKQVERARAEVEEEEQEAELRHLRARLEDLRQRRRRAEPDVPEGLEASREITPLPRQPVRAHPDLGSSSSGAHGEKGIGENMKVLMKLLPPSDRFSGRDNRNVMEDLSIFERLCTASAVPPSQWGQILYFVLKDDARRFFRTQSSQVQTDYDKMKKTLIARYLSPEKLDRIKMQYNNLGLRNCSSLERYGEELLRLYKFLPEGYATEASLIDKLVLGIGQEEVTRQYRTIRPTSYAAAMELVRVWAKPIKRPYKALVLEERKVPMLKRPGSNPPARKRLQNPKCGLCGLFGHYTRQCPDLPRHMRVHFDNIYRKNTFGKGGDKPISPHREPQGASRGMRGASTPTNSDGASQAPQPNGTPGN